MEQEAQRVRRRLESVNTESRRYVLNDLRMLVRTVVAERPAWGRGRLRAEIRRRWRTRE